MLSNAAKQRRPTVGPAASAKLKSPAPRASRSEHRVHVRLITLRRRSRGHPQLITALFIRQSRRPPTRPEEHARRERARQDSVRRRRARASERLKLDAEEIVHTIRQSTARVLARVARGTGVPTRDIFRAAARTPSTSARASASARSRSRRGRRERRRSRRRRRGARARARARARTCRERCVTSRRPLGRKVYDRWVCG